MNQNQPEEEAGATGEAPNVTLPCPQRCIPLPASRCAGSRTASAAQEAHPSSGSNVLWGFHCAGVAGGWRSVALVVRLQFPPPPETVLVMPAPSPNSLSTRLVFLVWPSPTGASRCGARGSPKVTKTFRSLGKCQVFTGCRRGRQDKAGRLCAQGSLVAAHSLHPALPPLPFGSSRLHC